MIIKSVRLHNFRNFKNTHFFEFDKINLITGKVGSGKSTISRHAILFALYGDSDTSLSSLVNKNCGSFAFVELTILDKDRTIVIRREIPTKLSISVDDIAILEDANTNDKNKWIENRFGSLLYFKRFRMFDIKIGVNLLEEGKTTLKKTLAAFHETLLNNIRQAIQDKKSLFEKYNKNQYLLYTHYPSQKRLLFLKKHQTAFKNEILGLNEQIQKHNQARLSLSNKQAISELAVNNAKKEMNHLETTSKCIRCGSNLLIDKYTQLKEECIQHIEQESITAEQYKLAVKQEFDIINEYNTIIKQKQAANERLNHFIFRLEARFKQSEYVYSNKDISIATNALKELDSFYSVFLLNTVKNLEPIINSVINKINFQIKFEIDGKNNFDFVLLKEGKEYNYKDLSSGQRLILTIAFQVAMLLDKGDIGFIVIDEGFSALDEENIILLYELFSNLPFQILTVIHRFNTTTDDVNVINLENYNAQMV